MAKSYRIVLQEGATHTRGDMTFVNGVPQVTTDLAKAKKYKADGHFTVTTIEDALPEPGDEPTFQPPAPTEETYPPKVAAPVGKVPVKLPGNLPGKTAPVKAPGKPNDDEAPI